MIRSQVTFRFGVGVAGQKAYADRDNEIDRQSMTCIGVVQSSAFRYTCIYPEPDA